MVLFGENLLTLQTPGWESQYIKYAELKVTIAKIKNATDEDAKAQLSTDFYTSLIKQVVKVNTFVQKQQQLAGVAFGKAGDAETLLAGAPLLQSESRSLSDAIAQTGDDAKVNKYLCALKDVSDTLTDIRHFVGTNVIAATKIVKKHDKNVPDELAKRSMVSDTICKQPFYVDSTLPQLASEVDVAIAKALAKLYTGKDLASTELLSAGAAGSGTDTDDGELGELRTLPSWLLKGADTDAKAPPEQVRFMDTYLTQWRFKKVETQDVEGETTGTAWNVDFTDDAKKWSEMDGKEKFTFASLTLFKIAFAIGCLYLFICSLSFLADGFRLVAGKSAGEVFGESEIFNNPVAGLMVGVLVTVLVQSSSTSTSIAITMVAADLLTVKQAIPIIMGANIGTSVTSTIVAIGQAADRDEFRRAFAAATVHDMFNFLTVALLLPLEAAFRLLYHIAKGIVGEEDRDSQEKPPDILKVITKPFTKWVVQIDKKIINKLAACKDDECKQKYTDLTFFKKPKDVCVPWTAAEIETEGTGFEMQNVTAMQDVLTNVTRNYHSYHGWYNATTEELVATSVTTLQTVYLEDECDEEALDKGGTHYIFEGFYPDDASADGDVGKGFVILAMALTILCLCLYGVVKVLRSILKGRVAVIMHKVVNEDFPDVKLANPCCPAIINSQTDEVSECALTVPMGWLSGYAAMGVGFAITIAVQSSSITTSALTPLVGVGVIKLERMYPTVLGANIGTTVTGLLAALAADGSKLKATLTVAVAHLFFNILGISIFYISDDVLGIFIGKGGLGMRNIPIEAARALGNITATYRWFPVAYIFVMFFTVPGIFTVLSIASTAAATIVFIVMLVIILSILVINWYQDNSPESLPVKLRTWDWLPSCCGLEWWDKTICGRLCGCVGRAKEPSTKDISAPTASELKKAVASGASA